MGCSLDFSYSFSNTSHLLSYDLCPLFSQHPSLRHEISEDTLPTRTNYVYEIALGKGIEKDGTLPEDLQVRLPHLLLRIRYSQCLIKCPHDSLVCMRAINTRPNHPSEPPRILQVIPVATRHTKPKFRIAKTTTGTDIQEPHLQLTVQGSEYMGMKQKAVFHIYCDEVRRHVSIFLISINFISLEFTWSVNFRAARSFVPMEGISCLQLEIWTWLPKNHYPRQQGRLRQDARQPWRRGERNHPTGQCTWRWRLNHKNTITNTHMVYLING